MSELERRYTPVPVELRAATVAGKDRRSIGGYAAMFGRESRNLGGFIEVVEIPAFNATRGDGWPEVMCRYNHDDNQLLGTSAAGTLRLQIDDTGLLYEVDPPESMRHVLELVERSDVRHSSFAFRTIDDDWGLTDQGFPLRSLLKVQLVDVAPVNTPAYIDTTAGLRSLAAHVHADVEEVRKLAAQDELRKFFVRTDNKGKPAHTFGAAARMALLARKEAPVK